MEKIRFHRLTCRGALLFTVLAIACGCSPQRAEVVTPRQRALALEVLADSAARLTLPAAPARRVSGASAVAGASGAITRATLTLERVSRSRAALQVALPEAAPAEPPAPAAPASDALPSDDALHAPIAREAARLQLGATRAGTVEVDVHVDAHGEVDEVRVVASSGDATLVPAAIDAASAMHFIPATRRGVPVAVWCRQRFAVKA